MLATTSRQLVLAPLAAAVAAAAVGYTAAAWVAMVATAAATGSGVDSRFKASLGLAAQVQNLELASSAQLPLAPHRRPGVGRNSFQRMAGSGHHYQRHDRNGQRFSRMTMHASGLTTPQSSRTTALGSCYIDAPVVRDMRLVQRRLEDLRRRLTRVRDLPPWRGQPAVTNTSLLWWFLRDRRLDVAAAAAKLERCLRWRQEFRVDTLSPESFSSELSTRKGYLHRHRDLAGRPVLVAIARRHNVLNRVFEESCRMCAFFMERAMDQLGTLEPPLQPIQDGGRRFAEGEAPSTQPEQALGIFDVRDFSPLQADLEFAGFLINMLHSYYPGRTGRVLFVGAPKVFKDFWAGLQPVLGRYAALADFVTVEEVQRRYFAEGMAPVEFQR